MIKDAIDKIFFPLRKEMQIVKTFWICTGNRWNLYLNKIVFKENQIIPYSDGILIHLTKFKVMTENHPFDAFVPLNSKTLILGSFPGKESTQTKRKNDWYYCAKRNQFWKILEIVFDKELSTFESKQQLFKENSIAITDLIQSCERSNNSNADSNLVNKKYNNSVIETVIASNPVSKILFTSKGVFNEFLANFNKPNDIELIVLPSPSPIYRRLNLYEKAEIYKKALI